MFAHFLKPKRKAKGYGIALILVFLATSVAIVTSLQMMSGPIVAAYLGSTSQNTLSAQQLAQTGLNTVVANVQNLYNAGTLYDNSNKTTYSYSSSSAPTSLEIPQSPDALTGAKTSVGSYTGSIAWVNGNTYLVKVTATVGSSTATATRIVTLSRGIFPLDNLPGATAAYGLRKLRNNYTGNAIQVRRASDNATRDIGFLPSGDLDTNSLLLFLSGTPATPNGTPDTTDLSGYNYNAKVLDQVSGAVAAYGLRKLRTAYTGNAITVRRDSDNTTTNIGFLPNGDLDTLALTRFCGTNSCFVTTWFDQSGSGFNATQATAAQQPRIVNAGTVDTINGRPAVRGLGDEALLSTSGAIMSGTAGWHYFTVLADYGGSKYYIDRNSSGNSNPLASLQNNGGALGIQKRTDSATGLASLQAISAIPTDGSPILVNYKRGRSSDYTIYYNGVLNMRYMDTDGDITPRGPSILGHPTTTTQRANAAMGELIIFNNGLNNSDRQTVENDQARYYGLTLTEPNMTGSSRPLDNIPNEVAAYSLRRLITSSYNTYAVQVERDSDNATKNIGFDRNDNLDTATLMDFCGSDSCYIRTWYDQVGGKNATQTDRTAQPYIVNAGRLLLINSRPTFRPSGYTYMNTTLPVSSLVASSAAPDTTVLAFVSSIVTTWTGNLYWASDGSNNRYGAHVTYGGGTSYFHDGLCCGGRVAGNTSWNGVLSFQRSGSNFSYWSDGDLQATATDSSTMPLTNNIMLLGANGTSNGGSPTDGFRGYVSELIFFNDDLSATNRQYMENNLEPIR